MKTYYEFFAGGGMVHAALGSAWVCEFANDFSAKKAESYRANWGDDSLVVGDIGDLLSSDLPGHADLAWGSFPCQDLSLAGNGAGLNGKRSGTFWSFISLMKGLKAQDRSPKVLALENVCGAITSSGGKDFEAILKALMDLGYAAGAVVIDAVHFVPQSRPRLFFIAVDAAQLPTNPCISDSPSPAWHPAAIIKAFNNLPGGLKNNWLWWSLPSPEKTIKTLDELIESPAQGGDWNSDQETLALLNMMSPVNRQKVLQAQAFGRLKVGTIYRRTREGMQRAEVRFDGVSGCLRTPGGGSSRQTILTVHGGEIRSRLLSAREAARLMGLDDSYVLPDRYNDAYQLAGDGVVVPVVAHLAKHIFEPLLSQTLRHSSELKVA
jgi:DNA (cytosine-5)-methyltransferase 1